MVVHVAVPALKVPDASSRHERVSGLEKGVSDVLTVRSSWRYGEHGPAGDLRHSMSAPCAAIARWTGLI